MQHVRRWIVLSLLLATPGILAQTLFAQDAVPQTPAPATTPHHKSHKVRKELVLPPLPGGPLSQLPMDQIPASPAKVSFQGGLLTISAQNSTLGEILRDVRRLTGASIDIPQGSGASERVATHLGPGAPRDVLAGLLNGSSFNYVMLGSNSDPTAVSSVILTAKPSSTGELPTQTAANVYENNPAPSGPSPMPPNRFPPPGLFNQQMIQQPGNAQPVIAQPAAADSDDSDAKDEDQDSADDSAEDQAQPGQPDAIAQPQQTDQNQPNAGPKTPEQIMEMLRKQQQPGALNPQPPPQ
jgi:hypothetical protein